MTYPTHCGKPMTPRQDCLVLVCLDCGLRVEYLPEGQKGQSESEPERKDDL